MSDQFWHDDIQILFNKNRLIEFFPTKDHTIAEKLNAIVRLAIYISIIMYLINSDANYFIYAGIVALFTIFIYSNRPDSNIKEKLENTDTETKEEKKPCTVPTIENPFMNFTMQDFLNIKDGKTVDRPPACDQSTPEIKKEIDAKFDNNLFKDVDDVFGKMNSQRQYFTMPWTSVLPDPNGELKDWLYKSPKTCKEDSNYCNRYEDIRQKAPIFVDPSVNPVKNT